MLSQVDRGKKEFSYFTLVREEKKVYVPNEGQKSDT